MSVEEARTAALCDHPELCPASWGSACECGRVEAVDRLILEVQAEMPCSNPWRMELQFDTCADFRQLHGDEPEEWCRSAYDICRTCTARQKLREAVPA